MKYRPSPGGLNPNAPPSSAALLINFPGTVAVFFFRRFRSRETKIGCPWEIPPPRSQSRFWSPTRPPPGCPTPIHSYADERCASPPSSARQSQTPLSLRVSSPYEIPLLSQIPVSFVCGAVADSLAGRARVLARICTKADAVEIKITIQGIFKLSSISSQVHSAAFCSCDNHCRRSQQCVPNPKRQPTPNLTG